EYKRTLVPKLEIPRLLEPAHRLPLVKAARRDDTAPLAHGLAEGGLRRDSLRARVCQLRTALRVFRPPRNQSPLQPDRFTTAVLRRRADRGNHRGWGD